MKSLASVVLVGLMGLVSLGSATPVCQENPATTLCCAPTQILFLLDISKSIPTDAMVSESLDFAQRAHCLFKTGRVQTGMITFGGDVKEVIPLNNYTIEGWYSAVEGVRNTFERHEWTPMAEAFWLAKYVFDNKPVPQVCATTINRVVVVLTDGAPAQQLAAQGATPPPAGPSPFANPLIPTTWVPISQTNGVQHGTYVQVSVPGQAKILKDSTGARIVMVALKGTGLGARTDYFKGIPDPSRTCFSVATGTNAQKTTFCNNRGFDTAAKRQFSQCYRKRDFRDVNPYGGWDQGSPWTCELMKTAPATPAGPFPIATDADSHVIGVEADDDTVAKVLAGTGTVACPFEQQCFA